MEFVAVDIETTDFSHKYGSILSIGAIHIKDWKVVGHFYEMIHTTRKIPEKITKITGIDNSMLYDARSSEEVLTDFLKFLGDRPFVAHNAKFDYTFINEKTKKKLGHELTNPMICTIKYAKIKKPGLENYKLDTVADAYGIPNLRHHNALNDARVCADILIGVLGREPIATQGKNSNINVFQQIKKALKNNKKYMEERYRK